MFREHSRYLDRNMPDSKIKEQDEFKERNRKKMIREVKVRCSRTMIRKQVTLREVRNHRAILNSGVSKQNLSFQRAALVWSVVKGLDGKDRSMRKTDTWVCGSEELASFL